MRGTLFPLSGLFPLSLCHNEASGSIDADDLQADERHSQYSCDVIHVLCVQGDLGEQISVSYHDRGISLRAAQAQGGAGEGRRNRHGAAVYLRTPVHPWSISDTEEAEEGSSDPGTGYLRNNRVSCDYNDIDHDTACAAPYRILQRDDGR